MRKITKKILINALNRLDELASYATEDNDNGEAQAQQKDYDLLFDFLNGKYNQSIVVPFTGNDIDELQNGEEFDWTFPSQMGYDINIHLLKEEYEEDFDDDN